ncbi:MAG: fructosamine kinase family protein [Pseudomonadota bacterium]
MGALAGPHHGWRRDNFIGSTPQINAVDASWQHFFGAARLAPQLALARRSGYAALDAKGEKLLQALLKLFGDHSPNSHRESMDSCSGPSPRSRRQT